MKTSKFRPSLEEEEEEEEEEENNIFQRNQRTKIYLQVKSKKRANLNKTQS